MRGATPSAHEDKDHNHDQVVAAPLVRRPRAEPSTDMIVIYVLGAFVALGAVSVAVGLRILKRYERGEQFRLSRVVVGLVERMHRVSLGIVTMPILAPAATRDDVCVDVSAVLCFRRVDASVANVNAEMKSIVQSAVRVVVGRHTLGATLSEPDRVARSVREIVDHQAQTWGLTVTDLTFDGVQLPGSTGRDMTGQGAGEHERRPRPITDGDAVAAVIADLEALLPRTPESMDRALASPVMERVETSGALGPPRANGRPMARLDGPT